MKKLIQAVRGDYIFNTFIENHPSVVLMINPENGEIIYGNSKALSFYGYDEDELTALKISQINILRKKDIEVEIMNARLQQRNFFEFVHRLKNGLLKKVNVISYPIELEGRQILMSFVSERDEYIQETVFDLKRVLGDAQDLLICVRKSDQKIVFKSAPFVQVMDYETEQNLELEMRDYLSEYSMRIWQSLFEAFDFDSPFELELHPINLYEPIKMRVDPFCLYHHGETFVFLKFTKNERKEKHNYDYSEALYEKVCLSAKGDVGRLICIEMNDTSINMQSLFSMFRSYFQQDKWQYEAVVQKNCIIAFSLLDSDSWLMKLHAFTAFVINETALTSTNSIHSMRIGISMRGTYNKHLFDDLTNVMDSFRANSRDVIHISERTSNYYQWLTIKNELHMAISNNQFVLYKQDIYNAEIETFCASEFLIRWNHPELGIISPGRFIDYAESTGLIYSIDMWVINEAFRHIHKEGSIGNEYHINVSPITLNKSGFFKAVSDLVLSLAIDPTKIVLELTEGSSIPYNNSVLMQLKNAGFKLAIDDFGTGYSSFDRIKKLDIDWIKIDKSFIDGIGKNVHDIMILKSIIALCENLEIGIITEGVETYEQLEFLSLNGCQYFQGYYFSKPSSLSTLITQEKFLLPKHSLDFINEEILSGYVMDSNLRSYKDYFYDAPVAMMLLDEKLRLLQGNVAFKDMFGFNMVDLSQKNIVKTIYSSLSKYNQVHKYFVDAMLGKIVEVVIERKKTNETHQLCRWHIKYNKESSTYMCIVSDITDAYKRNEQLIDFKTAMDSIDSCILVCDAYGYIQYANPMTYEKLIIDKNAASIHIDYVLRNRNGQIIDRSLWEKLIKGEGCRFETSCFTQTKELFNCQVIGYPAKHASASHNHFVFMVYDITSERKLEENNLKLKRKLFEQDQISSIGMLASGILHEINNPLTFIKSNYYVLLESLRKLHCDDQLLMDTIEEIMDENKMGLDQISSLILDMKKYIYNEPLEDLVQIDLVEAINSIINLSKNEYKYYAEIKFTYDDYERYFVLGRANRIRQVFMNLIMNASYAIKEKSKSNEEMGLIQISMTRTDDRIYVKVIDNGCGMNEESLSRIFDLLYTTKPSGVGSGLGMPIVKDIIENDFDGTIEIVSEQEVGTEVRITLKV